MQNIHEIVDRLRVFTRDARLLAGDIGPLLRLPNNEQLPPEIYGELSRGQCVLGDTVHVIGHAISNLLVYLDNHPELMEPEPQPEQPIHIEIVADVPIERPAKRVRR